MFSDSLLVLLSTASGVLAGGAALRSPAFTLMLGLVGLVSGMVLISPDFWPALGVTGERLRVLHGANIALIAYLAAMGLTGLIFPHWFTPGGSPLAQWCRARRQARYGKKY